MVNIQVNNDVVISKA